MTVLQDLAAEKAVMQAEIARLMAENAKLAQKGQRIKVSEKGAVSVYGMGRWPITLYFEQWEKLWEMKEEIQAFCAANRARLKVKPAKED